MQRVVSINLDGNAYQIEEDGYNALFAYLDAFETQIADDPERARKLADIERAAAEKCQACLGPHKTVVTSAEIDRIVSELGPMPVQPAAEPATGSSSTSSPGSASSANGGPAHRRLYQIREGAMISGVCVGLSEFLHIDVTLIRILFVIFAFASAGWGILAYGLLMFVVPHVATRAEASSGTTAGTMPPHHWPWEHGWPWDQPREPRQNQQDARQAARDARRESRAQRRAARVAYGPPAHALSTVAMILCIVFGFLWLSVWTRGRFFYGWPFFWGFPHWIGIVLFFMVIRLIFMPFRAARWYGYGPYGPYGPYAHPHYAWVSMWNGLAWFAVMIFFIWAAYHYIPEVHDFIRGFQTSWIDGGFHV